MFTAPAQISPQARYQIALHYCSQHCSELQWLIYFVIILSYTVDIWTMKYQTESLNISCSRRSWRGDQGRWSPPGSPWCRSGPRAGGPAWCPPGARGRWGGRENSRRCLSLSQRRDPASAAIILTTRSDGLLGLHIILLKSYIFSSEMTWEQGQIWVVIREKQKI